MPWKKYDSFEKIIWQFWNVIQPYNYLKRYERWRYMNMIEKLVKSGYPTNVAEEIYKQYMEFEQMSGNLDLDKIEDNKLNFD